MLKSLQGRAHAYVQPEPGAGTGEGTVMRSHGGAPKIARTPHLDNWRSLSLAVDRG